MERPLTIKNMDLQLSRLIAKFAKQPLEKVPSFESIVNEIVLDLMELARESIEFLYGSYSFKASVER
jgi:hypothetical protein